MLESDTLPLHPRGVLVESPTGTDDHLSAAIILVQAGIQALGQDIPRYSATAQWEGLVALDSGTTKVVPRDEELAARTKPSGRETIPHAPDDARSSSRAHKTAKHLVHVQRTKVTGLTVGILSRDHALDEDGEVEKGKEAHKADASRADETWREWLLAQPDVSPTALTRAFQTHDLHVPRHDRRASRRVRRHHAPLSSNMRVSSERLQEPQPKADLGRLAYRCSL